MNPNPLQSARHEGIRTFLRVAGPVIALIGVLFTITGISSFFASFGGFEPPRYFWCAFVGMPLLGIGFVLAKFGYLGSFLRYMAAESAPVAKDVVNYMGENTQPGFKAVAKAITEGVLEAQKEKRSDL